jgi:hypothetical protein
MLQQLVIFNSHVKSIVLNTCRNIRIYIDSPLGKETEDKTQTVKFGLAKYEPGYIPGESEYHSVENNFDYNTDTLTIDTRYHEDGRPYEPCAYQFYLALPANCRLTILEVS